MIHFDAAGTLIKPGVLGRLLRAFMGFLCLSLVWHLSTESWVADLQSPAWWPFPVRGEVYSGLPALRPSGLPSAVHNLSRRFCLPKLWCPSHGG